MHICVSKLTIIGSDNGLSPGWRQAIVRTNTGILLIWPLGSNFSEILIKIHTFSFNKLHWKMLSGKCWPLCLGVKVLRVNKMVGDWMTAVQVGFESHLTGTSANCNGCRRSGGAVPLGLGGPDLQKQSHKYISVLFDLSQSERCEMIDLCIGHNNLWTPLWVICIFLCKSIKNQCNWSIHVLLNWVMVGLNNSLQL